MPKLKPETQAARRAEILEAAEICFARDGFHKSTIQDVIEESGLSAGCIYGHFRDKEELIEAISARRHSRDAELLSSPGGGLNPLAPIRAQLSRRASRSFAIKAAASRWRRCSMA